MYDMRRKVKDYYVSVYEHFPMFKWKMCDCCGEEVKFEKYMKLYFIMMCIVIIKNLSLYVNNVR